MQGNNPQLAFHIPGTLSADLAIVWTAYRDLSLLHVSAVASNDSDGTIKIGTTSDDDAYLAACTIGDSSVPAEKEKADFVGTEHPHIVDGTVLKITVDYDGSGGTAAADVTIVLTFAEG
jgi:hypothetical protein